jgi:hypothetical protein
MASIDSPRLSAALLLVNLAASALPARAQTQAESPSPTTQSGSPSLEEGLLRSATRRESLARAAEQLALNSPTAWQPVLTALQRCPAPELDYHLALVSAAVFAHGPAATDLWLKAAATSAGTYTERVVHQLTGSIIFARSYQESPPCSMAVLLATFERLFPAESIPFALRAFSPRPTLVQPPPGPVQPWVRDDQDAAQFIVAQLASSDRLFPAQRAALIESLDLYFRAVYDSAGGVKDYIAAPPCRAVFVAAIDAAARLGSAQSLSPLMPLFMRAAPELGEVLTQVDLTPLARTPWFGVKSSSFTTSLSTASSPFTPQSDEEKLRLRAALARWGSPLNTTPDTERPRNLSRDVDAALSATIDFAWSVPLKEAILAATPRAERWSAALAELAARVESNFGLSIPQERRRVDPFTLTRPAAPSAKPLTLETPCVIEASGAAFAGLFSNAVTAAFVQRGYSFHDAAQGAEHIVRLELAHAAVELFMGRQLGFMLDAPFAATLDDLSARAAVCVEKATASKTMLNTEYVEHCTLPLKPLPDIRVFAQSNRTVLKGRQISLRDNEYREVLDFHRGDGSTLEVVVGGRIPTGYTLLLNRCPRALDGIGISLAVRSLLLHEGRGDLATNPLDCILNAPAQCLDTLLSPGEAKDFVSVVDGIFAASRSALTAARKDFVLTNIRQRDFKPVTVPGIEIPESVQRNRMTATQAEYESLAQTLVGLAHASLQCAAERAALGRMREEVQKQPDTVRTWVAMGGGQGYVAVDNQAKLNQLRELRDQEAKIAEREKAAEPWNFASIEAQDVLGIRPATFYFNADASKFTVILKVDVKKGGERWLSLSGEIASLHPAFIHLIRYHFDAAKNLPLERLITNQGLPGGKDPFEWAGAVDNKVSGLEALIVRESLQPFLSPTAQRGLSVVQSLGEPAARYVNTANGIYDTLYGLVADETAPFSPDTSTIERYIEVYRAQHAEVMRKSIAEIEKAIAEARASTWSFGVGFVGPSPFPFSLSFQKGDFRLNLAFGAEGIGPISIAALTDFLGRIELTTEGIMTLRPFAAPIPPIIVEPFNVQHPLQWDMLQRRR